VKYTSWRKLGLFNEMPDPMVTAASARETIGVVSGGTVRASGNCGKVSGYVESAPPDPKSLRGHPLAGHSQGKISRRRGVRRDAIAFTFLRTAVESRPFFR
jgi:hypothetical protein